MRFTKKWWNWPTLNLHCKSRPWRSLDLKACKMTLESPHRASSITETWWASSRTKLYSTCVTSVRSLTLEVYKTAPRKWTSRTPTGRKTWSADPVSWKKWVLVRIHVKSTAQSISTGSVNFAAQLQFITALVQPSSAKGVTMKLVETRSGIVKERTVHLVSHIHQQDLTLKRVPLPLAALYVATLWAYNQIIMRVNKSRITIFLLEKSEMQIMDCFTSNDHHMSCQMRGLKRSICIHVGNVGERVRK